MYRFLLRPLWLVFHSVVLAAIVTMVNLGLWQLDRLDERQIFNQRVIERTEEPPVDVATLLGTGAYDADRDEWTPVRLVGTYLPDQVVEFNQSQGGRAGDNVLTALALDDLPDATVIVNRGFVPLP
ncbi:MAG: SURF1 family protein, partial [Actinomycetota bacterium]